MNLFIIKTKPNRIESIGFVLGRFFVVLRNTFHPYGTFVFQDYFFYQYIVPTGQIDNEEIYLSNYHLLELSR